MKINLQSRVSGKGKRVRIEMLPLIDIVFLLLVFFIYAMLSMAVHRGLPVNLPVSSTAEIDTTVSLEITLKQNGRLYLDAEALSVGELESVLQKKAQTEGAGNGAKVLVNLFADQGVSYQELYRVLDAIRNSGISNVSLQADALR